MSDLRGLVLVCGILVTACETNAPVMERPSEPAPVNPASVQQASAPPRTPPLEPAPLPAPPRPEPRTPEVHRTYQPRIADKARIYDPHGPGFELLQAPVEALRTLPADRYGAIDWVQALATGLIAPRADIRGSRAMETLDLDILMKRTKDMPWVLFPHRQHTEWLACANCHPRLFAEKAGASVIDMNSIMRGEDCGLCHDKVAFSIISCERCHSAPHPGSPAKWW